MKIKFVMWHEVATRQRQAKALKEAPNLGWIYLKTSRKQPYKILPKPYPSGNRLSEMTRRIPVLAAARRTRYLLIRHAIHCQTIPACHRQSSRCDVGSRIG